MTFVNQLYKYLTNAGVKCWFDKKRLTVGEHYRSRIRDAIKEFDRVLVVISKDSLKSVEVEQEVLAALQHEQDIGGSEVIFPLKLDEAVMSTDKAWGIQIKARQIIEFKTRGLSPNFYAASNELLGKLETRAPLSRANQPAAGH